MTENQKAASNSGIAGANGPADDLDGLAGRAHIGIQAAADAVHPAIDGVASSAHHAVNSVDQAVVQTADTLAQSATRAGAKGEALVTTSADYIRAYPVVTIGVSVAAGYLLSRWLTNR